MIYISNAHNANPILLQIIR